MSSGPEHYTEAERLLIKAWNVPSDQTNEVLAAAQVHATLAQVAATVDLAHDTSPHIGSTLNADTWTDALTSDN